MKSVHSRRLPALDPWNNTGRSCTIREIREIREAGADNQKHWPSLAATTARKGHGELQQIRVLQVPKAVPELGSQEKV